MKIAFFPAALIFVIGLLAAVLGFSAVSGGGLGLLGLGIAAMTAGAALELWSRQRS